MRLIAEAGATKIQWGIIKDNKVTEFTTSGFNPNTSDRNMLRQLLVSGFPKIIEASEIHSILYFGAGCSTKINIQEVKRALSNFFVNCTQIKITTDIEAVGKAIFKNSMGWVGILGTGSSFGYYNGNIITRQALSLGYLLGDEGSGAYIGKAFLKLLLHKKLPLNIESLFYNEFNTNKSKIITDLYSSKKPNAYLASVMPFIKNNIGITLLYELIQQSILKFCNLYVLPNFVDFADKPIGLAGGIAYHFKDIVIEEFKNHNLPIPIIINKPFEQLIIQS